MTGTVASWRDLDAAERRARCRAGSPGSHPHADRRNWRPAETLDAYAANVREGLEEFSWRRVSAITGFSRAKLWRMREAQAIPADLFERLIEQPEVPSLRELAAVGRLLSDGVDDAEVERCPCCGHVLRTRRLISAASENIINAWLREQWEARRASGAAAP